MTVDTRMQELLTQISELRAITRIDAQDVALHGDALANTSTATMENPHGNIDRDLLEAKIEASEARTDAKFADVRSDLAGMRGEFAALRGDIAGIAASLREEIVNGRAQATTDNANLRTEVSTLLGENARTVGEIRGELQGVRAVVDSKPGRLDIWGAALAGFALLIGVLAYAGDRESVGLSLADRRQEQLQIDSAQNNMAASIDAKLDRLLAAEERTTPTRP